MLIDLHSHTTHSDGRGSPAELVRLAREAGVDVLAVTDHDTTDALDEAAEAGRALGVRVVAGIEMSSLSEGRDVHILGIGLDHRRAELQRTLAQLKAGRRERVVRICSALGKAGVSLSAEQVLGEAGGKSVGRRHVARALVKIGAVRTIEEAFGRYLGTHSPAYVPANEMSPADAARAIRQAGGVPVLAHPGFLDDDAAVERILDESGVRAVEVFHRYESAQTHLRFRDLARRRDLIATGGSDFHGDESRQNARLGQYCTPLDQWRRLERLIGS